MSEQDCIGLFREQPVSPLGRVRESFRTIWHEEGVYIMQELTRQIPQFNDIRIEILKNEGETYQVSHVDDKYGPPIALEVAPENLYIEVQTTRDDLSEFWMVYNYFEKEIKRRRNNPLLQNSET